jgi:hypothetical protein
VDDGARDDVARRRHRAHQHRAMNGPQAHNLEPRGVNVSVGLRARNQAKRFQVGRPPGLLVGRPHLFECPGSPSRNRSSADITAYLQRVYNFGHRAMGGKGGSPRGWHEPDDALQFPGPTRLLPNIGSPYRSSDLTLLSNAVEYQDYYNSDWPFAHEP